MNILFDKQDQARRSQVIRPVFFRLMIPLCIIVLLLLVGFTVALLIGEQRTMHRFEEHIYTDAISSFEMSLDRQIGTLSALEDTILNDSKLYEALQARDRERLLTLYASLYTQLKEKYSLTHFYFHLPDRMNLLRVHKPEFHGDRLDRFSLREAERLGKKAAGIELGPLGTFTLRVVQPVYLEGVLIGYLELGKEIEDLLLRLNQRLGVELAVTIRKQKLDRQQWEAGMKMLGREADWDRYKNEVLIYHSQPMSLT